MKRKLKKNTNPKKDQKKKIKINHNYDIDYYSNYNNIKSINNTNTDDNIVTEISMYNILKKIIGIE